MSALATKVNMLT